MVHGQFGEFRPNLFFDIEKEIDEKNKLLSIYNAELWKPPHPLSKNILNKTQMLLEPIIILGLVKDLNV